jgi:hypothetical protein
LPVSHPALRSRVFNDEVETRQIAPTILNIDADELKSVREEHTHPCRDSTTENAAKINRFNKTGDMALGSIRRHVCFYRDVTRRPEPVKAAPRLESAKGSSRNATRWLPAGTTTARNKRAAHSIAAGLPSTSAIQPG